MTGTALIRKLGAGYLFLQGFGALAWWGMLLASPPFRKLFLAPHAPDSTLMAFLVADIVLYVGGSLGSGWGLWHKEEWAWPVLCLHTGAGAYAALYCLTLAILSGGGWAGAIFMLPSLLIPPYLTWRLRPRAKPC